MYARVRSNLMPVARCYIATMTSLTSRFPLSLAILAVLAGCGAPVGTDAPNDSEAPPVAAVPADGATGLAYPTLYRDLNLPELPGGELVSTGRQTTSLRDGLSLGITTSMSVSDARAYYSDALGELGWEEAPSRVIPGAPMAGFQATRDGVNYMVTITAMEDQTQVNISVTEQ